MKNIKVILSIAILLTFASCSWFTTKSDDRNENKTIVPPPPPPVPTTASITEPVKITRFIGANEINEGQKFTLNIEIYNAIKANINGQDILKDEYKVKGTNIHKMEYYWFPKESQNYILTAEGINNSKEQREFHLDVALNPETIFKKVKKSMVYIDGFFVEDDLLFNDKVKWSGSGVIIDKKGGYYIVLTNTHVMGFWEMLDGDFWTKGDDILKYEIKVTMPNERIASLINGRKNKIHKIKIEKNLKDFALIYIKDDIGSFPVLKMSSRKKRNGEQAFAIGHPLGSRNSFTKGVISNSMNTKSHKTCKHNYKHIQTDAAINPGNSGGPLVNRFAEIIGINTLKIAQRGVDGMNFAIDADVIKKALNYNEFIDFPLNPSSLKNYIRRIAR